MKWAASFIQIMGDTAAGSRWTPWDPDPHRPHEPLQRPRHRQDRSPRMTSVGKGGSRLRHEFCNNAC
ncbi:hypothetical protein [Phaeovulum sp.]|uniref:hypothetical protein n=1 Tax=Phaeovulum sp. TaxID=2934796 RepID=UPI0039E2A4A3